MIPLAIFFSLSLILYMIDAPQAHSSSNLVGGQRGLSSKSMSRLIWLRLLPNLSVLKHHPPPTRVLRSDLLPLPMRPKLRSSLYIRLLQCHRLPHHFRLLLLYRLRRNTNITDQVPGGTTLGGLIQISTSLHRITPRVGRMRVEQRQQSLRLPHLHW